MAPSKWKFYLPVGMLLSLMLACSESVSIPTQAPEVVPEITQVTGELSPDQPGQYKVFIPEANSGVSTSSQDQGGKSPGEFDPHVIIVAERTELLVGEIVTIVGRPVQIGQPYYSLTVRDEGVQDEQPLASVSYDNVSALGAGASQVLEYVSVQADLTQVIFVLRARAAGLATVTIHATGEIYLGYPGPETIVGDGSGSILITVMDQ